MLFPIIVAVLIDELPVFVQDPNLNDALRGRGRNRETDRHVLGDLSGDTAQGRQFFVRPDSYRWRYDFRGRLGLTRHS